MPAESFPTTPPAGTLRRRQSSPGVLAQNARMGFSYKRELRRTA